MTKERQLSFLDEAEKPDFIHIKFLNVAFVVPLIFPRCSKGSSLILRDVILFSAACPRFATVGYYMNLRKVNCMCMLWLSHMWQLYLYLPHQVSVITVRMFLMTFYNLMSVNIMTYEHRFYEA